MITIDRNVLPIGKKFKIQGNHLTVQDHLIYGTTPGQ